MMRWFSFALALAALAPMAAGSTPQLHPFVQGSWNELRARHAGHPFVVHVWGVTCGPCRTEMPEWGKLLRDRSDLNLVLIDADLVPDDPEAVTAMLTQFGLIGAENWIFSDDFVERLRYEIDPTWQGEIPLTYLVARDGTVTRIDGVADPARVRAWLDQQKKQ